MEPRWRVGRKLGRTLYLDGQCVGMVDTPALAEAMVIALNGDTRWAGRAPWVQRCSECAWEGVLDDHLRPNSQSCPNTNRRATREPV